MSDWATNSVTPGIVGVKRHAFSASQVDMASVQMNSFRCIDLYTFICMYLLFRCIDLYTFTCMYLLFRCIDWSFQQNFGISFSRLIMWRVINIHLGSNHTYMYMYAKNMKMFYIWAVSNNFKNNLKNTKGIRHMRWALGASWLAQWFIGSVWLTILFQAGTVFYDAVTQPRGVEHLTDRRTRHVCSNKQNSTQHLQVSLRTRHFCQSGVCPMPITPYIHVIYSQKLVKGIYVHASMWSFITF